MKITSDIQLGMKSDNNIEQLTCYFA